jgi:23S rRNA (adenine2503-C2)-methyltransferase
MSPDQYSSIFDQDKTSLLNSLQEMGQPSFRLNQIWSGIYQKFWNIPSQFTNLPNFFRNELFSKYSFSSLEPVKELISVDKQTQKILFKLHDGNFIETVLMRYEKRQTLCISTQVGCPVGCVFCATGQMGFKRNLSSGEIIEQVLFFARLLQKEDLVVTNIVVMGMGEPFLNYDAYLSAIKRMNDTTGMALGARRFTLSTVGIIPQLERFTSEKHQINLAISLHTINDQLRSELIPINKKYPLNELLSACWRYVDETHRRISFEWALIQGVNDSLEQAHALAAALKGRLCHVNLIQLNPTKRYSGSPSPTKVAQNFMKILTDAGIPCSIRLRRGIEIQAGCGQLASTST